VSNPDLKFEKKYEKIVKQKVLELFGKTGARIFLFGSRARGDNRRGSDFDIGIEAVDSETFRKLVLDFDQFWEESIVPGKVDFGKSLSIDFEGLSEEIVDSVKSGRAQKFEICTELLWKVLKSYLWEKNGIDSRSPKGVVKECYNQGLLEADIYEQLIGMLDDRNRLSHVYNKQQFERIYQRIILTLPIFEKVLKLIES
jgi:nucleotidyltransferase substrate binding protein (TIGR01987 family)